MDKMAMDKTKKYALRLSNYVNPMSSLSSVYMLAEEIFSKFLRAAFSYDEGFIGLEINFDKEEDKVVFFTSENIYTTPEDIEWMFHNVLESDTEAGEGDILLHSFFEGNRRVYQLVPKSYSISGEIRKELEPLEVQVSAIFTDILKRYAMFCDSEMVARVIIKTGAGVDRTENTEEAKTVATFLISIDGEMSLKMRDFFTDSFGLAIVEVIDEHGIVEDTAPFPKIRFGMADVITSAYFGKQNNGHIYENKEKTITVLGANEEELFDLFGNGCMEGGLPFAVAEPEFESGESGLERLGRLIGLKETKEQVRRIVSYSRLRQDMQAKGLKPGPMSLNMCFVGNPGTAKTTVARILAQVFYETGLLKNSQILEVGRADIVGSYVGHTAAKVKKLFEKAKNRLVFIDEAYSLCNRRDGFSDEAVAAIVQEMENNRDNVIVVFAGYEAPMMDFIDMNPGLRSRIPFIVKFPDYSCSELVEITEKLSGDKGFMLSEGARRKIADICSEMSEDTKAGNGRLCRNLVEDGILNYAERCYGAGSGDNDSKVEEYVLTEADFCLPKNLMQEERRHKVMGFK